MAEAMRVLTVRQPWADAIALFGKDVENRTWTTKYRGLLAILAGRTMDGDAIPIVEAIAETSLEMPLRGGSVIALVDLVGVHHADDHEEPCSPWAQPEQFHWELANARPLARPFGLFGSLGLRVATPDVVAEILERAA